MTSTPSPALQKADLDAVSLNVPGLISKQTAELESADMTVESVPEGSIPEVRSTRVERRS